ncbi:hypothetical protein C8R44DRAFT_737445 [Mycena epipterygia]|nr:hypothetical protein C8R44DRAFT_737445 [Mycena epipterygia]
MPPQQPTATDISNIIASLTPAVTLLNTVDGAFGTPFIQAITNTTTSLINTVQNVKRNKYECLQLMENIDQILYAIVNLHIKSETAGSVLPSTLDHIGKFTETLHKIHAFLGAQQDGNKIKHFFRQSEMNTLRKDCHVGLKEALEVFKAETGLLTATNIAELQKRKKKMHQELLELIENLSDGSISDSSSSIYQSTAGSQNRFFITADSATTSIALAALMGSHMGLKPGTDLTKPVLQYLSGIPPCLLVLDNLETPWEPLQSRAGVEEFLSLVTDVPHLALIITMRGAERPVKVRWTRPFLEPLKPLSYTAAKQTFIEIADDCHDSKDIDRLLQLTDNMPLAVDLIAHLVDYEGCSNVLARWETEKTSLLSAGYDKGSNLDASIAVSLVSSRMTSCPGAKDLLSLLSVLPDGLSDVELLQYNLPIEDLLRCRATLLCTSLAYYDNEKQLKSLVPVREYIYHHYPPSPLLFHALCKYFHSLLDLFWKYRGLHQSKTKIKQITSNIGNLQQLLLLELHPENQDLADAINCALRLNYFCRVIGHGPTGLMDHIPAVFPQPCDHQVEVKYLIEMFCNGPQYPIANPDLLIDKGITHLHQLNDPVLEAQFLEKALLLATICGDSRQYFTALEQIVQLKNNSSDYSAAQIHAHEVQHIPQLSGNLYLELKLEVMCLIAEDPDIMFHLAEVHLLKSEYPDAQSIYNELAQDVSVQRDPYLYPLVLLNIAQIDVIIGADVCQVQENVENAKTKFSSLELIKAVNQCETILADLNLREGNTRIAKKLLQQCLNTAWRNDPQATSYCLERLADVGRWTSTGINWSDTWSIIYLVHAHKTQEKAALYRALRSVGDTFVSEGDEYTAHSLFSIALEGFTYMDIHCGRADCMLRLGDIAKHRGDLVKAADLWRDAHPLFERSLQLKETAQINTRLVSIDQEMLDTHQKTLAYLNKLEAATTWMGCLL